MCFSNEAGFREQKKPPPLQEHLEVIAADNAIPAGNVIVDTDLLENNDKTTLPFVKNNEFDYGWPPLGGGSGNISNGSYIYVSSFW